MEIIEKRLLAIKYGYSIEILMERISKYYD